LYVDGNITVDSTFDHSAYPDKPKIFIQYAEPNIPPNTSAFWYNPSQNTYYLILDVMGTQKKVLLD
ncbi:MAG: hypothetical protein DRJ05_11680, partial [Bacteroidetes bacterium]